MGEIKQEWLLWQFLKLGDGQVHDRVHNSSISLKYTYYFCNRFLKGLDALHYYINFISKKSVFYFLTLKDKEVYAMITKCFLYTRDGAVL